MVDYTFSPVEIYKDLVDYSLEKILNYIQKEEKSKGPLKRYDD